jgi:hypothetical protein
VFWLPASSGKTQKCGHFSVLPSNAAFCRAFGNGGRYNSDSRVRHDCGPTDEESSMGEPFPGAQRSEKLVEDRLGSWKEIAAYLKRDVTTAQRWEKREGMPGRLTIEPSRWRRHNRSRWRRRAGQKDPATNGPLCPPAEDHVNSRTCWRSVRSDVPLLSTARHHHRRSPDAGRIPTSPAWRTSLETINTLSR